jgi:hypothetical protein
LITRVSVVGASAENLFGSSSSLRKREIDKVSYQGRQQNDIQTGKHSRVHVVEEFSTILWFEGFPSHSLMGGGTGRSDFFDTFPLPIHDNVFRKSRRGRRCRTGSFQRILAFVSILAVLSLRGFGGRRNRNMLNVPSFWDRRARNKKSMILQRQDNPKDIRRRIKGKNRATYKHQKLPQVRDDQNRNGLRLNP